MHADLQRKLIRLLKGRHHQVIVATHSVEIMAEVDAQDVLIINRMAESAMQPAGMNALNPLPQQYPEMQDHGFFYKEAVVSVLQMHHLTALLHYRFHERLSMFHQLVRLLEIKGDVHLQYIAWGE